MQYDLLIERTLRDAQGILRANLPPAKNLPDDQAVQSLRAIVRRPQVREVLERGNDTALCFVLRAVNRILSNDDQPDRAKINRLWDVLEPEFNRNETVFISRRFIAGNHDPDPVKRRRRKLLTMRECIEIMEEAYAELARSPPGVPPATVVINRRGPLPRPINY
jgi:hypothetical protein